MIVQFKPKMFLTHFDFILVINIKIKFGNKRLIVKFDYSLGPKVRLEVLKWVGGSMRLAVG